MIGDIGLPELLIVLVIILLLFGVGRVSKVGKELGSTISEFRKGLNEGEKTDPEVAVVPSESKSGTSVKL